MKFAFWSNEQRAGVTANLAAMSVAALHINQCKTIILENHYSRNNLARYLIPASSMLVNEMEMYYLGHGTRDCLVQLIEKGTNKKRAEDATIELIQNNLFYLPQNRLMEDFFDYEFQWNQLPLIKQLEEKGHHILIDTKTNNSLSSKLILDEADLVIVNLKQDINSITDFFDNYASILDKAFFIISDFRYNQGISKNQILNEFEIDPNRFAIIPHNLEFRVALSEGRTVEFIHRHICCNVSNPNFHFINHIMYAANLLMNHEFYKERMEVMI